jgi:hypothetical protein
MNMTYISLLFAFLLQQSFLFCAENSKPLTLHTEVLDGFSISTTFQFREAPSEPIIESNRIPEGVFSLLKAQNVEKENVRMVDCNLFLCCRDKSDHAVYLIENYMTDQRKLFGPFILSTNEQIISGCSGKDSAEKTLNWLVDRTGNVFMIKKPDQAVVPMNMSINADSFTPVCKLSFVPAQMRFFKDYVIFLSGKTRAYAVYAYRLNRMYEVLDFAFLPTKNIPSSIKASFKESSQEIVFAWNITAWSWLSHLDNYCGIKTLNIKTDILDQ